MKKATFKKDYQWLIDIYDIPDKDLNRKFFKYVKGSNINSPEDLPKCPYCDGYCIIKYKVLVKRELPETLPYIFESKYDLFEPTCKKDKCIKKYNRKITTIIRKLIIKILEGFLTIFNTIFDFFFGTPDERMKHYLYLQRQQRNMQKQ